MGQQRLNQKKTAAPTRTQPTKTSVKSPVHPVEELQGAIGNREMGRLMETNRLPHPSSPFPKLQGELPLLGGMMPISQGTIQRQPLFRGLSQELTADTATLALPATGAVIQPKLTLGTPNDMYEQEADAVARQVVDEIHSSPFREQNTRSEEERKPEVGEAGRVQRQITVRASGDTGGEVSSEWEGELQRAKSGGQPLSLSVKEPMERAFGADFGGVRVHTGTQADRLARSIQAKAFTTGQDVFFRQGAYEPGSRGGQELVAHELTHVVQQKAKDMDTTRIKKVARGGERTIAKDLVQQRKVDGNNIARFLGQKDLIGMSTDGAKIFAFAKLRIGQKMDIASVIYGLAPNVVNVSKGTDAVAKTTFSTLQYAGNPYLGGVQIIAGKLIEKMSDENREEDAVIAFIVDAGFTAITAILASNPITMIVPIAFGVKNLLTKLKDIQKNKLNNDIENDIKMLAQVCSKKAMEKIAAREERKQISFDKFMDAEWSVEFAALEQVGFQYMPSTTLSKIEDTYHKYNTTIKYEVSERLPNNSLFQKSESYYSHMRNFVKSDNIQGIVFTLYAMSNFWAKYYPALSKKMGVIEGLEEAKKEHYRQVRKNLRMHEKRIGGWRNKPSEWHEFVAHGETQIKKEDIKKMMEYAHRLFSNLQDKNLSDLILNTNYDISNVEREIKKPVALQTYEIDVKLWGEETEQMEDETIPIEQQNAISFPLVQVHSSLRAKK